MPSVNITVETVDTHITLDGTNFVNVGKDERLYPTTRFTVAGYVNTENWNSAVSNQLFGNYYNQGFGIFYNSGIETDFMSLVDSTNGIVLNLNDDGRAFFQRALPTGTSSDITTFSIDRRGVRSIVDNSSHTVFVLDADSVDLHTITLPSDSNITNSDVDGDNGLWLFDQANCHIYWYDSLGTLVNSTPFPSYHNNFAVKPDRSVVTARTNDNTRIILDCDGNYYYLLGQNLYRNGTIFYHVSPSVSNFNIDTDDNIWVTYEDNRMLKLTIDGRKIFDMDYHSIIVCSRQYDLCKPTELQYFRENTSITFTRENLPDGSFRNFTWVLLKEYNYLMKLNSSGKLVKCVPLADLFDLSKFEDLDVSNLDFNANADFSDYSAGKRFSNLCDLDGEPYIQGRIVTQTVCGRIRLIELSYDASLLRTGEHHFAMTYDSGTGTARLFVDGSKVDEVVDEPGLVYYDYKPPFLIGAKSGKFNASQKEQGLLRPVFFIGEFDDVRLYSSAFGEEDVNTLTKIKFNPRPLHWTMELDASASYLEQVEHFFLHRPPGYKSGFFNIRINNLGITDESARADIETKIRQRIDLLKPAHTTLHSIVFSESDNAVSQTTVEQDVPPVYTAFVGGYMSGAISDPGLDEISGLTRSNTSTKYFWALEDSGASAELNAIYWNGEVIDTIAVDGATNTDWEDIASATVNSVDYIYIFDTGNNTQGARTYHVYRVPEPLEVEVEAGTAELNDAEDIVVEFGAGGTTTTPDIETGIVDPDTGDIYFITKRLTTPEVYKLPHQTSYSGTQTAEYIGSIANIPNDTTEGYSANAVGGDARPDGMEVVIKTYEKVLRNNRESGGTFEEMILGTVSNYVDDLAYVGHGSSFGQERKGEIVAYVPDGLSYVTLSERDGGAMPDYIYEHVRFETTTAEFQFGTDGYAGSYFAYNDEASPGTNFSSGDTYDIDSGPSAKEAFIHFDDIFGVSLVPDAADIVGGYLELVVTDTGSGLEVFESEVDWLSVFDTMTWNTNPFNSGAGGSAQNDVPEYSEGALGNPITGDHVTTGTKRVPISGSLIEKWKTNNLGLVLLPRYPSGDGGIGISTPFHATVGNRPKLVVVYKP